MNKEYNITKLLLEIKDAFFVSLHNHYEYSNMRLLDSINKIEDSIKYVVGMGQNGLAITDHECLSGHVEFLQTVEKLKKDNKIPQDFKPILGNEIYLVNPDMLQNQMDDSEQRAVFYHFLLLAKDEKGHEQLRKLSTKAWTRAFNYKNMERVPTYYSDFEEVIGDDGCHLIGSTACLGGYLAQLVLQLLSVEDEFTKNNIKRAIDDFIKWGIKTFGRDDFYIEIQPSETEEQIAFNTFVMKIVKGYKLKHIITTDAHYLNKEAREVHKAYLTSADEEGSNREVDAFYSSTYFHSVEELKQGFSYMNEEDVYKGIINTKEISDKIEVYSLYHRQIIPTIKLPKEETWKKFEEIKKYCNRNKWMWIKYMIDSTEIYDRYLINQVFKGINKQIKKEDYREVFDRINLECMEIVGSSIAKEDNMSSYFVTMQKNIDIIWEEANSIVAPGRGSSGGYVINYLLGITQVNPLTQGVLMPHWRFISAERPDYPDIDIDIPSHKRDFVFEKIGDYYKSIGGRIVRVCTFGTETSPSAIKTACRGLKINSDIAQHLTSLIPVERGNVWSLNDCYYGNEKENRECVTEFKNIIDTFESKGLLKVAMGIENLKNKRSSHPCGVLIVNEDITKYNALMRAPSGELITQFNLGDSEFMSGLKYDFLNTKNCAMVQKTLELLLEKGRIEWQGSLRETYNKYLHPDNLIVDSKEMWELLNTGQLISAFQFDSPVGEQAIKLINPSNMLEAVNGNNLMRLMGEAGEEPPMDRYVRYKRNIDEWYFDMKSFGLNKKEIEIMERHLLKDYGVCSTQEAMMMLTMDSDISKFNVVESNIVRKGVAKKVGAIYEKAHKLFYKKGETNKARKKLLDYVWNVQIAMQRGYGFSLLHGIEYTYILIQQLNLIFRYDPIYWNTAVLIVESGALEVETNNKNRKDKTTKYGVVAKAISNMQHKNIKISLPNINLSKLGFEPIEENNEIIFGLKGIVGVNKDAVHEIINHRPYKSLMDFHKRLVVTKKEVILKTGKKQNKSLVSEVSTISLIKAGAFDKLENKSRIKIMEDYLLLLNPPKKSMNIQGINQVIDLGIIPNEHQFAVRIYNFKKYLTNKKFFVENLTKLAKNGKDIEKVKSKGWYILKGSNDEQTEQIINFFNENFILELKENEDYYYNEQGELLVLIGGTKGFLKVYENKISGIRSWLNSKDCLSRYNKIKWDELWESKVSGSISKWEMDSLSFYYHEHELSKVKRNKYGFKPFDEIVDSDSYTKEEKDSFNFSMYKGVRYPQYPLTSICGTILDKDKNKHTITLLTETEVVLIKYYGGNFGHYNKQISEVNADGTKTVIEKSWFSRGNKLLVTGYRRGDQFKPKVYRNSAYQHTTCLIEKLRDDGTLELKLDRTRI